jgi:hypothetical protein
MHFHFTYVLQSQKDNTFYIGCTSNLNKESINTIKVECNTQNLKQPGSVPILKPIQL